MHVSSGPESTAPNHPLAVRMGIIAFLAQNTGIGLMFGSFGLLLGPIEAKLGIARDQSTLGVALVMLGMALMAPVAGALSAKMSLRTLMIAGAAANAAGYALLAFATSFAVYLLAYGLFIGPGLALLATITPSTLVTRWFQSGRGRALGLVNMPVLVAVVPPVSAIVLANRGLEATYLMLAGVAAAMILPLLLVVDAPPAAASASEAGPVDGGLSAGQLMARPAFWILNLASGAIAMGATMLGTHLVPMASSWGFSLQEGATLAATMALAGIVGSVAFGWIADRIGGAAALAIVALALAGFWAMLLLRLPYPALLPLIALIGMPSAAITATYGMALSQTFGAASFGRAFGLSSLIGLPFIVASAPVGGWFYVHQGSYAGAIMVQVVIFVAGALAALSQVRRRREVAVAV